MPSNLLRRRSEPGLRLWPVGLVLPLTFAVAIAVAAAVFATGWDLLGAKSLRNETALTSKTLFELVKLSFGVVAGAGALVALVVAYRRQRVDEDGALRDATRLHTERFTTAVSQLGDDSSAVRLGGVHALASLADDAPTRELRQTCIDVLCAYLCLPFTTEADLPADDDEARHTYLSLRAVRHTIIRLIRDHLCLPADHPDSWQGHDLDFTGAIFDGGNFDQAAFTDSKVSFAQAEFVGNVSFDSTKFASGIVSFDGAKFVDDVSFTNAEFAGGSVSFAAVKFLGDVSFNQTKFTSGSVNFFLADFACGTVGFGSAEFAGCHVTFLMARFTGGTVAFAGEELNTFGLVLPAASGKIPSRLVPPDGQPLPPGLILPSEWIPQAP